MGTHPGMQVRLGRQTSHGDTSRNASEGRRQTSHMTHPAMQVRVGRQTSHMGIHSGMQVRVGRQTSHMGIHSGMP